MRFANPDIKFRALAAYYRQPPEVADYPAGGLTEVVEHDGVAYVVLANDYRVLAVYQVRPNSGALMRLQDVPAWVGSAEAAQKRR